MMSTRGGGGVGGTLTSVTSSWIWHLGCRHRTVVLLVDQTRGYGAQARSKARLLRQRPAAAVATRQRVRSEAYE